jgi:SAM-dependent methyltransferase
MPDHSLLAEFKRSLANDGLAVTLYRIGRYPYVRWQRSRIQRGSTEDRFTRIYHMDAWVSRESRSGKGSELIYTENLRRHLPEIFERFGITSILDAPCGDFNWMQHVISGTGLRYVGGDIVRPLIEANQKSHASANVSFVHLDIIGDPLPAADLMICRDCLFHLSNADIKAFLANFERSAIPYLLTTNHLGDDIANSDIETGSFRLIDLFAEPFGLPEAPLARVEDYIPPFPPREMILVTREQVQEALRRHRTAA